MLLHKQPFSYDLYYCRIHKAVKDGAAIMDVDGSYLYQKHRRLEASGLLLAPVDPPSAPLSGWEAVTEANASTMAQKLPCVTMGMVYNYLASHTGRERGEGTFRALTRGYTHWASGRIERLDVNCQNPEYCHVQSVMKPSMKQGSYHIWLLLQCTGPLATICRATCECAAG